MILSLDYFNGMGLQRFFSESATLPQLKQICLGLFVIALISSNFSLLARTQMWPVCSPLQVFSAMGSSFGIILFK